MWLVAHRFSLGLTGRSAWQVHTRAALARTGMGVPLFKTTAGPFRRKVGAMVANSKTNSRSRNERRRDYFLSLVSGYKWNRISWLGSANVCCPEVEPWNACKMGVFSNSVTLATGRIWNRLISSPNFLRAMAIST
jgi:hypothetical protein